ncbi:FAD:protein FMN transferase [Gilliamella apicola]|uniref:FAD:protein FMN transferase n=1 Tax=Gilliamella apicola TaxID=1196095 RepID=UPI0015E8DEE9|nr:FAD:protein FMN transferase [Gilliamella apicola]
MINPYNVHLRNDEQTIYLSKKGVEINLGGNVLNIGCSPIHDKGYWSVGIQNPSKTRGNIISVLMVKNVSVVTSGIYERCFKVDNKIFHHLFDTNTGMLINTNIASVTIIANKSIDAEVWSTAGFQSSVEKAIDYLSKQKNIEFVVIDNCGKHYYSKGLIKKINIFIF